MQNETITAAEIKRMRVEARLRQSDVASALGCSRELVSMWETGRCRPSSERLRRVLRDARPSPTMQVRVYA